jgi:hypothetical protein
MMIHNRMAVKKMITVGTPGLGVRHPDGNRPDGKSPGWKIVHE